jgi:hypothetical protein
MRRASRVISVVACGAVAVVACGSSDDGVGRGFLDAAVNMDAGSRADAAVRHDGGGKTDAATSGRDGGGGNADGGHHVDSATGTDAASAPDTGTAACGCNGRAGCAAWQNVYMTWYGYNDNSCGSEAMHGCNDIADPGLGPKMHQAATEGAGTYDDPSTCAASDTMDSGHVYETSGGVTLTPGTLIYNPEVQQYFIFEDSCLECGDEYACKLSPDDTDDPAPPAGCVVGANLHIDFWMGPNDASQPDSLGTCEDNATIGNPYAGSGVILVNPPPNLPVKLGMLYSGASGGTGGCFTSSQVNGDSCP